ncbi:MAG: MFS transporter, partial [Acetobacteraceae bacterium]|nr:MFS transporter [Acetobacteraceae bacterium]
QHDASATPAYAWALVAMLWAVSFCNYADRSVLSAVMPQIRTEFGLSLPQLGLLSSAFLWVYAIAASPAGYIGDRFSRKKVIVAGLVAWSIVTFLSPLAGSFTLFLLLRALTGLGEASYYPTGTALISDYHGPETRSRALAIHQTAVFAGGGIGTIVAAALAQHYQWRMPFYVYGAIGVVLAFVLAALMRDTPPAVKRQAQKGGSFAVVLHHRSALMLFLVFFFATSVSYGVTIWAPTFFHNELHFNLTAAAFYGALTINLAGFIAVLCSGTIADWAAQRVRMGRFYVLSCGLFLATLFLLPFGLLRNPNLLGLCLLLSGFCKGLFDGSIYAAMHDVVPPAARASAVGLMTTVGFAGAGLSPLLIGKLGEIVGLGGAFSLIAVLYIAAVLLLLVSHRIVVADMDDTDRIMAEMGGLEEQVA